jgi:hypothetical protein
MLDVLDILAHSIAYALVIPMLDVFSNLPA